MQKSAYFTSPESAVGEIRSMLITEDWARLATYYDLNGSDVEIDHLLSGDFFIRRERPIPSHPGGFWRYRRPFPPSFEFAYSAPGETPDIVVVHMRIKIEQGDGAPIQEGFCTFRMRSTQAGYQILAD